MEISSDWGKEVMLKELSKRVNIKMDILIGILKYCIHMEYIG